MTPLGGRILSALVALIFGLAAYAIGGIGHADEGGPPITYGASSYGMCFSPTMIMGMSFGASFIASPRLPPRCPQPTDKPAFLNAENSGSFEKSGIGFGTTTYSSVQVRP